MLIALIDGGIDTSIYPNIKLKSELSVGLDGKVENSDPSEKILTDHGTTCASIITKYAPEAEFYSLRIFHKPRLRTSCEQLIAALEWCLNARIPIIHLSGGTSLLSDYRPIRSVVAKLLHQRQIIVAAHGNNSHYSIPACLSGVLGVSADEDLANDEYKITHTSSNHPAILASSRHTLILPSGCEIITPVTNSYAAPAIMARVHNILSQYEPFSISVLELYELLFERTGFPYLPKPDFIENAVIYNPCGHPVLKHHLFFSCIGEYRTVEGQIEKYPGKHDLVYLPPNNSSISEPLPAFLGADISKYENLLFGGTMGSNNDYGKCNGFVWNENNSAYLGQKYELASANLNCPVVNIFGRDIITINLLCNLRDLFFENGYQCACLSDHPFSYLYNIEYVTDSIHWQHAVENVKRLYSPDLLINGFQKAKDQVKLNPEDYFIFIGNMDEFNGIHSDSPRGNLTFLPSVGGDKDILSLYNGIVQYFV